MPKYIIRFAVLLSLVWAGAMAVSAQDTATVAKAESQPDISLEKMKDRILESYHLEFAINEMENGRKVNTRRYSTNLATNEGDKIEIGTRMPVESKTGEYQYVDVGTSIYARLGEVRGQSELTVTAEVSNSGSADENPVKRELHPALRQMKMGGSVLLPVSNTFVMSTAEDPNSNKQYQLEVKVTKLK